MTVAKKNSNFLKKYTCVENAHCCCKRLPLQSRV